MEPTERGALDLVQELIEGLSQAISELHTKTYGRELSENEWRHISVAARLIASAYGSLDGLARAD